AIVPALRQLTTGKTVFVTSTCGSGPARPTRQARPLDKRDRDWLARLPYSEVCAASLERSRIALMLRDAALPQAVQLNEPTTGCVKSTQNQAPAQVRRSFCASFPNRLRPAATTSTALPNAPRVSPG